MAVQTATGINPKPPGESIGSAATKQGTRPAGETYKSGPNRLTRGGLGAVRRDSITGGEIGRTGYAQNGWGGASSAGVVESNKLSDFAIDVPDEALDKIIKQGVGYKQNDAAQEMTGQKRPISDKPFPAKWGMSGARRGPKIG